MSTTFPASDVDALDPQEAKFYWHDWTAELNTGATIVTSVWTGGGLTVAAPAIETGNLKTRAKLAGAVDGVDYVVTNTVTTTDGETLEASGIVRGAHR